MTLSVIPCRTCGEPIELEPRVGQEVECPACGEAFVVASAEPLELAYAYDLEEDGTWFEEDRPHRS